jgi:hypothetical protein
MHARPTIAPRYRSLRGYLIQYAVWHRHPATAGASCYTSLHLRLTPVGTDGPVIDVELWCDLDRELGISIQPCTDQSSGLPNSA